MKVTAILPDEMVADVQEFAQGKNLTDSLTKALNDWLYMKRIQKLNANLKKEPIQFVEDYSAEYVRNQSNRELK